MEPKVQKILELLHIAEKLKMEIRHSFMSNGREESSAEHSWRLCLMVLLIVPETKLEINMEKILKMAIIHDLVEAEGYDIPAFEKHRKDEKSRVEQAAAEKYKNILSSPVGDEIYDLWREYELRESNEAKMLKALDSLEARLQHNEADLSTWNDIEHVRCLYAADKTSLIDDFVEALNQALKAESRKKMSEAGLDIKEYERRADELRVLE